MLRRMRGLPCPMPALGRTPLTGPDIAVARGANPRTPAALIAPDARTPRAMAAPRGTPLATRAIAWPRPIEACGPRVWVVAVTLLSLLESSELLSEVERRVAPDVLPNTRMNSMENTSRNLCIPWTAACKRGVVRMPGGAWLECRGRG